jgi:hypothetical protein
MRPSALLAFLLLCAGCSDDSPTAPSGPPANGPRSGAWVGTLTDPVNGTATLRFDLVEQMDGGVSLVGGTWAMAFADPQRNVRGSVSGLLTGSRWEALGSTEPPISCPPAPFTFPGLLSVTGTFTSSELTGTLRYERCTVSESGAISLRRP